MQAGTASSSSVRGTKAGPAPPDFQSFTPICFFRSRVEKNSRARVVEDETRKPRDGVECNTVFSAVPFNHFSSRE